MEGSWEVGSCTVPTKFSIFSTVSSGVDQDLMSVGAGQLEVFHGQESQKLRQWFQEVGIDGQEMGGGYRYQTGR